MPDEAGADPAELQNYIDAIQPLTDDLEGKVSDLRTATSALLGYSGSEFRIDIGNQQTFSLASNSHVTMVERLITEIKETDEIAQDTANSVHIVEKDDNLWKIAEQQLKDASGDPGYQPSDEKIYEYWVELKAANQDNLRSGNPDLIYEGEELYLPPVPGATPPPQEEEDEEDEPEEPEDIPEDDEAEDVAFVHDMGRDDIIAVLTDPTFIQGPPPEVIAEMAVVLMGPGGDVAGAGIAIDALIARPDAAEVFMADEDNVTLLYSWADALEAVKPMGDILAELEGLQSGN